MLKVVLDTNVLVATVRSRRGASFRLLELLEQGRYSVAISPALVLEYEEVLCREISDSGWTRKNVDALLNMLCSVGDAYDISFRFRPLLRDADDDKILELACTAGVDYIVTHNLRDFAGSERFRITVVEPRTFLQFVKGNV
jgi:putative PIN family toxin of toxin-antitoxin system